METQFGAQSAQGPVGPSPLTMGVGSLAGLSLLFATLVTTHVIPRPGQLSPWYLWGIASVITIAASVVSGLEADKGRARAALDREKAKAKAEELLTEAFRKPSIPLGALMDFTRMEIAAYHDGTMSRADKSFKHAQISAAVGLLVLVGGATVAILHPRGAGATWAASGLGGLGSVLAAYIASTHLFTHRLSLAQLNHYFNQPVVTYQVLQAERLAELVRTDGRTHEGHNRERTPADRVAEEKLCQMIDVLLLIASDTCRFSMQQGLQTNPMSAGEDLKTKTLALFGLSPREGKLAGPAANGSTPTPDKGDKADT